ncbi:MAG: hypothetical protein ABSE67_16450 [Xanthobacteraceae bacterium]|jgi:hypothetical protein
MEKEKKTKPELEVILFDRCREYGLSQVDSVEVAPHATKGWEARYIAPRLLFVYYSPRFEVIVAELRETFALAEE